MKIVKLVSRNIKNLKAIEITPTGGEVLLTGKNGAGKSAIIDSIFSALTGTRLKDPIRHGEDRADVTVEMDGFTVRKVWTEKGETIQVYSVTEEGKKVKYSSPQTFLDEKIGELSFDPMEFKNMKPTDQVDLLKKVTGLDFADIDAEKERVYEERRSLNIKIKESLAHLQNAEAPDPSTPDEEIGFKDALKALQDLRDLRQAYVDAVNRKSDLATMAENDEKEADEVAEQIKKLQAVEKEKRESAAQHRKQAEEITIPQKVTPEEIVAKEEALHDIENKNAEIRAAKRYRQAVKNGEKLKKEADALTERIRRLDQDKATRVANTKFPIPGLRLIEDAVVYQIAERAEPIRFDRLSTGQQIRVSTAIGMALNPELRVIFIREGSMLDTDNLKEIVAQAKDKDYQVWIERCDESGQVGFFIEAGEVKAIDGKEAKATE